MTDDKLIDLWTEDDLDRALGALHSDVLTDDATLAQARSALFHAIGEPQPASPGETPTATPPVRRKRRWAYPLTAAAAVTALVTTGFLITANTTGGNAVAAELGSAAAHITSTDPVVPPGKFRKVTERTWGEVGSELTTGGGVNYLQETVTETWIPADLTQEWTRKITITGRKKWIVGSDKDLPNLPPETPPPLARAKCGDFHLDKGQQACATPGNWLNPTPDWIAGLPRDPKALYQRLREDSPRNGRGDTELLVYAADALGSNLLPAELRGALYRALGHLDDLEVTDRAANLDGRRGVSFGSDDGSTREEIIIDPGTGVFIGSRQVITSGEARGRVVSFTSVSSAITATAP